MHLIIGKKSFPAEQLVGNYSEVLGELIRAKPAAAKWGMAQHHHDEHHGPASRWTRPKTRRWWRKKPDPLLITRRTR